MRPTVTIPKNKTRYEKQLAGVQRSSSPSDDAGCARAASAQILPTKKNWGRAAARASAIRVRKKKKWVSLYPFSP